MKTLKETIVAHLKEADKTYPQHFAGAMKTSRQCLVASIAAAVHGLLPFLFLTTASDLVREMYQRQNAKR